MKPGVFFLMRFLCNNYLSDSSDHNAYETAIFEVDNPLTYYGLVALAGIGVKYIRQTRARLRT